MKYKIIIVIYMIISSIVEAIGWIVILLAILGKVQCI